MAADGRVPRVSPERDDDLRKLPLYLHGIGLEHLLTRHFDGVFISPFERGRSAFAQLRSSN
jgi:hypothetical protein